MRKMDDTTQDNLMWNLQTRKKEIWTFCQAGDKTQNKHNFVCNINLIQINIEL